MTIGTLKSCQGVKYDFLHLRFSRWGLLLLLYLSMRKVDRFIRKRLLRQEYPYILPENIKR